MNISNLSQPSLKGARVPPGHVLVHAKFQGNQILHLIQDTGIKPVVQEGLGIVDFYSSNQTAVIWIPEEVLVAKESSLQKKLTKFDEGFCNGIACIQVTSVSHQYYKKLQLFALTISNVTLVPVKSSMEMVKFLTHLVYSECSSTQTFRSAIAVDLNECVLGTIKVIPTVGEKKAKELLERFQSLAELCNGPFEDMRTIVGSTAAQHIRSLFDTSS